MTATHEQLYRRTLRALVAAGVPFVVLGTFALRRQCPPLPRRLVADCDLQLPPNEAVLTHLTQLLQAAGWQVTLWEKPVQLPLTTAALAGKYYLRARRVGAVLDCTYEHDSLSWPEFQASSYHHEGLPLMRAAAILQQKAQIGRPRDLALLDWWQQTIGPL
ncbi:hypothetical protein [Hymenobacter jeollabukensis]|uniref:Nucleotidyltransferase family protein n=1 Tax=Hymenobacter jeollabukensis TaxID=2025313 RepID=A0A5R8WI04_9BACT|nr:hypothetical protein [Hymenobacter jeollabukensis]TLM87927.1 hypothetical protein FDY95_25120 [Hymenobacter jeollabukensis]